MARPLKVKFPDASVVAVAVPAPPRVKVMPASPVPLEDTAPEMLKVGAGLGLD